MADNSATVVLHVITRFSGGGSERRLVDAVAASPDFVHHVLVGNDSNVETLRKQSNVASVTIVPALVRPIRLLKDVQSLIAVYRQVRRVRPTIVHTHQSKAGLLGRICAAALQIPAVHSLSMANFGPGFGRLESAAVRLAERICSRVTTAYAVVGDDLIRTYRAAGITRSTMRVIRSSIELETFRRGFGHTSDPPLPTFEGSPILAFVGRFEELKGVLDLPVLLELVRDELKTIPALVLAGDGPLRERVTSACAKVIGDDHVVALGHTGRVPEVMRLADVVVLPSRAEGLPQVLVQAIASGTCFACFRIDGAEELLRKCHSRGGAAVGIGDLPALAREICTLFRAGQSPTADLSEWEPQAVQAEYRDLYSFVLASCD